MTTNKKMAGDRLAFGLTIKSRYMTDRKTERDRDGDSKVREEGKVVLYLT